MTEEPRTRAADEGASLRITLRGILAGALTIAGQFTYLILMVGHTSGSGSYVRSQFPMVALMPFVMWLFVNVLLKRLWPRLALTREELLTVFSMLWVVGALPQWGWSDYLDRHRRRPRVHGHLREPVGRPAAALPALARPAGSDPARDRQLLDGAAPGSPAALGPAGSG